MIFNFLIFAAIAASFNLVSAEFPLVWICLGLTMVGILIALYVAYRRPMEPYSPDTHIAEPMDEEEPGLHRSLHSSNASEAV